MTTVAYHKGELASDSRITGGEQIVNEEFCKIISLPSGCLIGVAGNAADATEFFTWARNIKGVDPTKSLAMIPDCSLSAIWVRPDGTYCNIEDGRIVQAWLSPNVPAAIGSGSPMALGALHSGATPYQAVMAACKVDIHSGGKIRIERISRTKGSHNG